MDEQLYQEQRKKSELLLGIRKILRPIMNC